MNPGIPYGTYWLAYTKASVDAYMFDKSFVRKRMRVTLALPALLSFSWRDVLACLSVLVPPTPMITQDCRRIEPGLFGGTVPPSSDFLHAAGPFHLEQGSPSFLAVLICRCLILMCLDIILTHGVFGLNI